MKRISGAQRRKRKHRRLSLQQLWEKWRQRRDTNRNGVVVVARNDSGKTIAPDEVTDIETLLKLHEAHVWEQDGCLFVDCANRTSRIHLDTVIREYKEGVFRLVNCSEFESVIKVMVEVASYDEHALTTLRLLIKAYNCRILEMTYTDTIQWVVLMNQEALNEAQTIEHHNLTFKLVE